MKFSFSGSASGLRSDEIEEVQSAFRGGGLNDLSGEVSERVRSMKFGLTTDPGEAEQTITFDTRRVPHASKMEVYVVTGSDVSPVHLPYIDDNPKLMAIRNATLFSGRKMMYSEGGSLLWLGSRWAFSPHWPQSAYGCVDVNLGTRDVVCRRFVEPQETIPEAIVLFFGSKYFGSSIYSLAEAAIAADVLGDARLPVIVHNKSKPDNFIISALDRIGLDSSDVRILNEGPLLKVERLWVPYLPVEWNPQHKTSAVALDILRQRLGVRDAPAAGPGDRIYISRKDSSRRKLLNEDDLVAMLETYGFKSIEFTTLSAEQRVEVMKNAKIVVGGAGSNTANTAFVPGGAWVIELLPEFRGVHSVRDFGAYLFSSQGFPSVRVPMESIEVEGVKMGDWNNTVRLEDVRTALDFVFANPRGN